MSKYTLGLENGSKIAKGKYRLIAGIVILWLLFITFILYIIMGDSFAIVLGSLKIVYLLIGTLLVFYWYLTNWRYAHFNVNLSETIVGTPIEDSERPKNKILNWVSKQLYSPVEILIKDISHVEFGKKYVTILNTSSFPFKKISIPVSLNNFDSFKKELELAHRK